MDRSVEEEKVREQVATRRKWC